MKTFFIVYTLFLSGCSLFGGGSGGDDTAPTKPPRERGTFHIAPYTDPVTGKHCNAGNDGKAGYCDDDAHCHSDASKCLKQ